MMNVSFDLRRDNRCMCPGCQIAFNRKKEKANKKGVCVCVEEALKRKGVK
jgi:hypothetical protein